MSGRNVGFDPYKTAMSTPHGKVLSWFGFGKKAENPKPAKETKKTQREIERERIRQAAQKKFIHQADTDFYDSDWTLDTYRSTSTSKQTSTSRSTSYTTKKPIVDTAIKKFDDD